MTNKVSTDLRALWLHLDVLKPSHGLFSLTLSRYLQARYVYICYTGSFSDDLLPWCYSTPTREKTHTLQSFCARKRKRYHKGKNLPVFRKEDIIEIGPIMRHHEFIPQLGRNFTNCLEIWGFQRNIYSTLISKCCKVFAI